MWLEGDSLLGCFTILESTTIGFDEFDVVGDDLKAAAVLSIICDPLMLIEVSNNGNSCSLMEIEGSNFCQFLETNDFDPAGLFLGGLKSDVEGRDGSALGIVEYFGICAKVACQGAIVYHGWFSFLVMVLKNIGLNTAEDGLKLSLLS